MWRNVSELCKNPRVSSKEQKFSLDGPNQANQDGKAKRTNNIPTKSSSNFLAHKVQYLTSNKKEEKKPDKSKEKESIASISSQGSNSNTFYPSNSTGIKLDPTFHRRNCSGVDGGVTQHPNVSQHFQSVFVQMGRNQVRFLK